MERQAPTSCTRVQLYSARVHRLFALLPIDLLFGLVEDAEPDSPKGYSKKWTKQMSEAYQIASENSKRASAKR